MNSTSSASRHGQCVVSPRCHLAPDAQRHSPVLILTSSPKCSFKAPTTEDFDKGARPHNDEPLSRTVLSRIASFWSKVAGG
ncbi:hypothetical protein CQ048_23355 [Pseudomonas trivialis]|nr:hypothetical protein CQ048_23355 [Pseudomonas trivialis]PRB21651.1 hypothetical protein CQ041_23515 [Pseudomonas sp. MYb60]